MSRTLRTSLLAALVVMLGANLAQARNTLNRPVKRMTSARSANFYRHAALNAAGIPRAFHRQTRVSKIGQTADGRTIMSVTPKLNRQQRAKPTQLPAAVRSPKIVVGSVTGRYGARKARVLSAQEMKDLGFRQPEMAKRLARYQQGGIFAGAKGKVYGVGGSRSGKSYRFVKVLSEPHVGLGQYGVNFVPKGGTIERSVPARVPADYDWSQKGSTSAGGKGHQWKSYGHIPGGKMTIWKLASGQANVVDAQPGPQ